MMQVRKSNRTLRLVVGSALYQAAWFATVLSAGTPGRWWWGPASVLVFIGVVLPAWPALRRRILVMMAVGVGAGLLLDSGMIAAGIWTSPRLLVPAPLAPLWLLWLWAAFGIYMAVSLEMLYGRYRLAAIAGSIGGLLAYRGGILFGAVIWGTPAWFSVVVMLLAWAIAFPALIWVATRLQQQQAPRMAERAGLKIALM